MKIVDIVEANRFMDKILRPKRLTCKKPVRRMPRRPKKLIIKRPTRIMPPSKTIFTQQAGK